MSVKKITWDTFNDGRINGYTEATKYNLENVNIPHDAIISNDVNCTDDAHISAINVFYDNIIESTTIASDELVIRQVVGQNHTNVDLAGMTMPEISILLLEYAL